MHEATFSGRARWRGLAAALLVGACATLATPADAQDLASVVAKARDQIDNGNYAEGARILATLKGKTLPPALAIEVGLLETGALLVTSPEAASAACSRAVVAAGFDPEVARDQSPRVREVCRAAAAKVRGERLASEGVTIEKLEFKEPEVAYAPLRVSSLVAKKPAWLRVAVRVQSSELEGTFDVPLIPSEEGPMLGTLDASWLRPGSQLTVALVPQDKFGDLGAPADEHKVEVPEFEAVVALGEVPSGAVVELDGDAVKPDAQGRIPTKPGQHEVSLTLSNGASASADVDLKRGSIVRVALAPQLSEGSRVLPWIATVTALSLGATGAVFMIVADSRRSDLEEAAARREPGTDLPASSYADLQTIDDQRATFSTVGTGLLIGAGATAVLATVLWLIPSGPSAPDEAPDAAYVVPVIGPGFVGVQGAF